MTPAGRNNAADLGPTGRAGHSVEDSRWIVHKTCEHTDPFATCMEGSCPALRSKSGWDFVLTDDGWRWVHA